MNGLLKPSYLVKIQKRDVIKYLPSNMYAIANADMNKGWDSPFLHYTESITGVESKIPKSSSSSLMDALK